jgi:hypothetical protein
LETERVHDVDNLDGAILDTLLSLLGRCVGTNVFKTHQLLSLLPRICGAPSLTDIDSTNGNHSAIDLVDNAIDLLHWVTVGHEFVTGNDILKQCT